MKCSALFRELSGALCLGILATIVQGAPYIPDRQFLLDTGGASVDVRSFYGKPDLNGLPVRSLWTRTSVAFWTEQDGKMAQRFYEETGTLEVKGTRGVVLRPRDRPKPGVLAWEMFVPDPDVPSRVVLRRTVGLQGTPDAWTEMGQAVWCVPHFSVGSAADGFPDPVSDDPTTVRTWTSRDGKRTFRASLVGGPPGELQFRGETGSTFTAGLEAFAPDDQILLLRWIESHPWPVRYPQTVAVPMSVGIGLSTVAQPADTQAPGARRQPYSYQTEHFYFGSSVPLGRAHLQSIGASFEATRRLLRALPWNIPPPLASDGKHLVSLFLNRNQYHEAGGSPSSAAIYTPATKEFLVPFESIGLAPGENDESYEFKGPVVFDTLHHELTHQQMHPLLFGLPMWIIEGSAEFIGNVPYEKGQFRIESSPRHVIRYFAPTPLSKTLAERGGPAVKGVPVEYARFEEVLSSPFWPKPPDRAGPFIPLQPPKPDAMPARYRAAFLLVYHFVYLDADRSRLPRYLAAARRLGMEKEAVFRHADAYQREIIDPYNRCVLENHARVDAYNRLARAYNESLTAAGGVPAPGRPIWAVLGPPPKSYTVPQRASVFFPKDAAVCVPALTWTIPGPEKPAPLNGLPGGNVALEPQLEFVRVPIRLSVDGEEDPATALNASPLAEIMRSLQASIFGEPQEISARVNAAFKEHGFPLPPPVR